jgi:D-amino-acid dehydrogenase
MRVVVLGAGVVGTATAWFLAKAGHAVTVLDRQNGAGLETSFANAGQVSPGYSAPWAGPGIPAKAIKWLMMRHRPLVLWPLLDARLYDFIGRMLVNCTTPAYRVNKTRMVRLAEYSRDVLKALRAETGIEYDQRARGTLQLFRTQQQLDGTVLDTKILSEFGVPYAVLDNAGCIGAEPALARVAGKFVGGLRLPGDETGDAHVFTQKLAVLAEAAGVTFRYGTTIEGIDVSGDRVAAVRTASGLVSADAYVVALGSYSRALLRPLGLRVPVYPVKGYSITAPLADDAAAPVSTVMDETFKIAITRLGNRIRVGGTAELAGYSLRLRPPRKATLLHSVQDLFPGGGHYDQASFWTGLRPMTPDGTPVVGRTRYTNLWLNTGHGTLGWTMACGSGRVVAGLVGGEAPEIDVGDLGIARYAA